MNRKEKKIKTHESVVDQYLDLLQWARLEVQQRRAVTTQKKHDLRGKAIARYKEATSL